MKSTEYSVVFFPLRKIFTNFILRLLTKYYSVLLCNTHDDLKLYEVAFFPVDWFYNLFTKNGKFPYLVVQIEVRLQRTCKTPEKATFCFLITIYHEKEITRLKCYGTNSTNSGAKTLSLQNHWKFSGFAGPIIIKPRHSLVTIFIPYGL